MRFNIVTCKRTTDAGFRELRDEESLTNTAKFACVKSTVL